MMRLYIFDKSEQLQAVLANEANACPFWDAVHDEKLNGENTFSFSMPADREEAQYVVEGSYAAFQDADGYWQLFEIRQVADTHGDNGIVREVFAEHAYYELIDDILTDVRPTNVSAALALQQALQNSRWVAGTVDNLGTNSTNFYYESALSAVQKVASTWKGELQYRVTIANNQITARYVDLLVRRGAITGKRFEYTKDIKEIKREVDASNVITACYGRGKGEEVGTTADGKTTYGRRLTFADVVWTTPTNPTNKPAGQEWVGDDTALALWGRNGRHRFGIFLDDNETDPAVLLQKTWDYLQENKTPRITYSLSVLDLERLSGYEHEAVRLGDTVNVIDKAFSPAIELSARVIEIKRNLLLPENTEIVLGNFAPTLADSLTQQQQIISNVRDRQGVWDRATQFNPDGTLDTSWLAGIIDTLQNQVNAGAGTVTITNDNGILITDSATNPTKALRLLGGIFAIANSKNPDGSWNWRTFGTGDGFVADEIKAGTIDASKVNVTNLNASNITTGTMTADKIRGGTLILGGLNNQYGVINVKDAGGNTLINVNSNGLFISDQIDISINDAYGGKGIFLWDSTRGRFLAIAPPDSTGTCYIEAFAIPESGLSTPTLEISATTHISNLDVDFLTSNDGTVYDSDRIDGRHITQVIDLAVPYYLMPAGFVSGFLALYTTNTSDTSMMYVQIYKRASYLYVPVTAVSESSSATATAYIKIGSINGTSFTAGTSGASKTYRIDLNNYNYGQVVGWLVLIAKTSNASYKAGARISTMFWSDTGSESYDYAITA